MQGAEQGPPRGGGERPDVGQRARPDVGQRARPDVGQRARPDVGQPARPDVGQPGLACWLVALVVVLAVPGLHQGPRDWWPWVCVAGLVLGTLGLLYVRRGRGNAAGARKH